MKIRIKKNTIRFRLRQPEVQALGSNGVLTETIEFGFSEKEKLSFILKRSSSDIFNAEFKNNSIMVYIPARILTGWLQTDLVGISDEINMNDEKIISVLIEKDFACLDANAEENIGSYPNPLVNRQPKESAER